MLGASRWAASPPSTPPETASEISPSHSSKKKKKNKDRKHGAGTNAVTGAGAGAASAGTPAPAAAAAVASAIASGSTDAGTTAAAGTSASDSIRKDQSKDTSPSASKSAKAGATSGRPLIEASKWATVDIKPLPRPEEAPQADTAAAAPASESTSTAATAAAATTTTTTTTATTTTAAPSQGTHRHAQAGPRGRGRSRPRHKPRTPAAQSKSPSKSGSQAQAQAQAQAQTLSQLQSRQRAPEAGDKTIERAVPSQASGAIGIDAPAAVQAVPNQGVTGGGIGTPEKARVKTARAPAQEVTEATSQAPQRSIEPVARQPIDGSINVADSAIERTLPRVDPASLALPPTELPVTATVSTPGAAATNTSQSTAPSIAQIKPSDEPHPPSTNMLVQCSDRLPSEAAANGADSAAASPRRRRPSATYIPPHMRRRLQEEKAKRAAEGVLSNASAAAAAIAQGRDALGQGSRGGDLGVRTKGRGFRSPADAATKPASGLDLGLTAGASQPGVCIGVPPPNVTAQPASGPHERQLGYSPPRSGRGYHPAFAPANASVASVQSGPREGQFGNSPPRDQRDIYSRLGLPRPVQLRPHERRTGNSRDIFSSLGSLVASQEPVYPPTGTPASWGDRHVSSPAMRQPAPQGQPPPDMPTSVPYHYGRSIVGQSHSSAGSPASSYPPYSRGTLGFRQPSHERPQYQHLLAQANSMHGITQSMPASFHLRSPSRPQMRCPEGFEEVSQNHLRYNPHHGETPAPAPQPLSVPDTDALARQVGALRLHEHDTAEHNAHARNSQGRRIGESGGARHPGRDFRAPPRGMLRNEAEDLRAQADERERNRLRKLQSAKSRGWDARKTEDGLDARGDDRNDPERIALRQGPDRVAEDRARRARLLRQGTASDHDDEPGVVYPEPGRLEPIDFGDEATNAARQGQAASGQQPQHQESQSGGNGELPPLPELIEPGVSWADIMDEEDWK